MRRQKVCSFFFFFKQKTAYERVSGDWSSDVCSSDLALARPRRRVVVGRTQEGQDLEVVGEHERVGDGVPRAMPTVFVDLLAQLAPEERRAGVEPAPGFEPIEEAPRQEEGSAGRHEPVIGRLLADCRGERRCLEV